MITASIARELGRLGERVEQAARAQELDTPENQEDFQAKRNGGLAVMTAEELSRWALGQAKEFPRVLFPYGCRQHIKLPDFSDPTVHPQLRYKTEALMFRRRG